MDQAQKVLLMVFISNNQTTEVLQPGEQSLHFVTSAVSPQRASVLCCRLFPVASVGRDHFNSGRRQLFVQRVAVIRLISDQSLREFVDEAFEESVSDKGDFMRRSRRCVNGERKTSAVCHCHELRTFAPLGFSHSEPPFLATTNIPSMKHSLRSSSPRARRSSASASSTLRKTPSRTHCWNRRWQVWYGGKRSGKSSHRAPLLKTQRMPLITSRLSFQGLPRPSSRRGGSGMSGAIIAHCSSVNSSRRAIALA